VEGLWAHGWHALGVQPKDSDYRHVDTFDSPDAWLAAAAPYVLGEFHVWLMVNAMSERPPSRGRNTDITSSRALSMDLDYLSPPGAHDAENLPTAEQVVRALAQLGEIAPNLVVRTGWGFQAHWRLACDVDTQRRQGMLYALADRLMEIEPQLRIERLDLAGMFRVPGSRNIKIADDPRPVVVEHWVEGPGFVPQYLEKRCPPVVVSTHVGGARHQPGEVTEAQRELLAYLVEHHGAHGDWSTRDGQIRLNRPDKSVGHQANIWMGEDGDAIVTVFSPEWPEIGPEGREDYRNWRLDDGKLIRAYRDPLGGIKFIATPPGDSSDAKPGHLPDEFWQRPLHAAVRDAAAVADVPAEGLMLTVLVMVAAHVPPFIVLPGPRWGTVNLIACAVGPPGVGKGTLFDRAKQLVPYPKPARTNDAARTHRLGTAQGFIKEFYRRTTDAERKADPNLGALVRHHGPVVIRTDEIATFAASTKGNSESGLRLIGELKRAVSGEGLGSGYATDEKNLRPDELSYRAVGLIGVAPVKAAPLFDDLGGGLPERLLFTSAGTDANVGGPGEFVPGVIVGGASSMLGNLPALSWSLPMPIPNPHAFTDEPDVAAFVAATFHARGRSDADPLDLHALYLRHMLAALLAVFDGRWNITGEDFELAQMLMGVSLAVRSELLAVIEAESERVGSIRAKRARLNAVQTDEALAQRRQARKDQEWVGRQAIKIADAVRAEPGVAVGELRRKVRGPRRRLWDEALQLAKDEGWVVEIEEPGQGTSKRVLHPGPKVP
jgi:hypothetical protein